MWSISSWDKNHQNDDFFSNPNHFEWKKLICSAFSNNNFCSAWEKSRDSSANSQKLTHVYLEHLNHHINLHLKFHFFCTVIVSKKLWLQTLEQKILKIFLVIFLDRWWDQNFHLIVPNLYQAQFNIWNVCWFLVSPFFHFVHNKKGNGTWDNIGLVFKKILLSWWSVLLCEHVEPLVE